MKIGIVLGGGGAKGLAHIGVLKTLRKHGIEAQVITGTSIGSFVGAAYACDRLDEMERRFLDISFKDIPRLLNPTLSSQGFFSGKNALTELSSILNVQNIEDLPRRFAAIAVDLMQAEIVSFNSGNLLDAVRASIAVPGLFTPVISDNRLLVDGGVLEPVPVAEAIKLGAEYVIAVDLYARTPQTKLHRTAILPKLTLPPSIDNVLSYMKSLPGKLPMLKSAYESPETVDIHANVFDIFQRTLHVSQYHMAIMRYTQHPPHVLLRPDVADVGFLDFHKTEELIRRGQAEAEAFAEEILRGISGLI